MKFMSLQVCMQTLEIINQGEVCELSCPVIHPIPAVDPPAPCLSAGMMVCKSSMLRRSPPTARPRKCPFLSTGEVHLGKSHSWMPELIPEGCERKLRTRLTKRGQGYMTRHFGASR